MNLTRKHGRYVLLLIIPLLLLACSKEVPDYREPFTGAFLFTTETYFWDIGPPGIQDTAVQTFRGSVRIYSEGDEEADLYIDPDLLNHDSSLFITFLPGQSILTEVTEDGRFISRGGYHYHCTGTFLNPDELNFRVEGLGGLGSGYDYKIAGTRISPDLITFAR